MRKLNNVFQLNTRCDMTKHEEVVHSRHVRIFLPLFFFDRRENREKAIAVAVAGAKFTDRRSRDRIESDTKRKALLIESGRVYDYYRQWQ